VSSCGRQAGAGAAGASRSQRTTFGGGEQAQVCIMFSFSFLRAYISVGGSKISRRSGYLSPVLLEMFPCVRG
jgi:hypothetical protein